MFNFKNQKLLVIAPHPDDEAIGCGGTIAKVKQEGGKVYVLFLTVGSTKDFSKIGKSTLFQREREVKHVAAFLQFDDYHIAFPGDKYHLKLDIIGQHRLMDVIERESSVSIENIKPTMVAFPSFASYNQDHRIAAVATHAALRPAAKDSKHFVETVLSYESPADEWRIEQSLLTNFFVSLEQQHLDAKLQALKRYRSQLRAGSNPRSLDNVKIMAMTRGSQCGSTYAEAFTAYRISA